MLDRGQFKGPLSGPTTLLFGSLALSLDQYLFTQIRKAAMNNEDYVQLLAAIKELPNHWRTITSVLPSLGTDIGLEQLEDLKDAFQTGRQLDISYPLPNKVLIPLSVLHHLTQYAEFVEMNNMELDNRVDPFSVTGYHRESLGLCTGLLSAAAAACTSNREQFGKYGAVAIRLGLLVGMVVDAEEAASQPSKSLSVAWTSDEHKVNMLHILESFQDAYISVKYDGSRATVTTTALTASKLQHELKSSGLIASEIGLYGRFHAECHRNILGLVFEFCDGHPDFQFPDAFQLIFPCRSNDGGSPITKGALHHHILRSILIEPPRWYETFAAVRDTMETSKDSVIVSFGPERCVPPSLIRQLSSQVLYIGELGSTDASSQKGERVFSDDDIAVVGMSCKVPGADDLEEFWDSLCVGKSQHREVPKERFGFDTVFREDDSGRKWYGNFINGHDKFDHKFFKKSPRESATMDPQQRQFLQIAYQAVEQSGYFHNPDPDRRVGCYVGVCSRDYENNIACHAPNAFSATGNLQGFIAGKVSHYFGWTGPGLVIDTACSSSAVAVHQACRAILSGECNAALAGGTIVDTNPLWFQNLAGASFLSPTGQCKPFDAKADGYCRGEAVASVFLKKLSAAIADGDQVLGIVAATAVQQNENCTPIFVPNVPSLSDLFQTVTKQARLKPSQISVVEAHGTGTAIGDPAEYDSIRRTLGSSARTESLVLGSVKGLVGHTECSSGIVSMVKTLLMIQKGIIPPQASFNTINPAIKAGPEDKIVIPTSIQPWSSSFKAALINNYGASGSNASMILTQPPSTECQAESVAGTKYPFWLGGFDDASLRRYAKALSKFLKRASKSENDLSLCNISFNSARQSNRLLERAAIFSVRSTNELHQKLDSLTSGDTRSMTSPGAPGRSVVLCFGGQVSTYVGLNEITYQRTAVLRKHLNNVDAVARTLGVGSIFPDIFQTNPIKDTVKLQTVLFAMQYSSALSWIDSGIRPAALMGHSFGELTALCVSQVLSLEDTLRMIIGRATLVRDSWGDEKGAMMAVEADLSDVERLLTEASQTSSNMHPASIACYNGPRSFTLAGSEAAISEVAETVSKTSAFSSFRTKILNVTNAFHCSLVEPLRQNLEEGAKTLTFREPKIPIERATELPFQEQLTARFVADHMRSPVFFSHALQRLSKKYPSCVYLEAGSNSTIASMASRALSNPEGVHFQNINITSDNAWDNLTDATLNLWKAGIRVHHWAHQASQTRGHRPLLLPPYQFEGASHWIGLKQAPKLAATAESGKTDTKVEKLPERLLTFIEYQDSKKLLPRFRVNTMTPQYKELTEGHVLASSAPMCPATVQLDLIIEAIREIRPDLTISGLEPQIHAVENQSPICINPIRTVWIDFQSSGDARIPSWNFEVFSTEARQDVARTTHTTGKLVFCSVEDRMLQLEFARLERQVGHARCLELLRNSANVDEVLQNRSIYKIFAEVVDYGEDYRGLQKLVSCGNQSAGLVVMKYNPESWLDPHLSDSFCQVGGIFVNCMTDQAPTDMFVANGIEKWIRSPKLRIDDQRPDSFHVIATHHRDSDKTFLTDIFVFNPTNGALLEAILGINYARVSKASMGKLLSRLTGGTASIATTTSIPSQMVPANVTTVCVPSASPETAEYQRVSKSEKAKKKSPTVDFVLKVKEILADLSGIELEEIRDDSQLPDLGIDSLMGIEMTHEIESAFKIKLPEDELMEIIDVPGLMKCVQHALGDEGGSLENSTHIEDGDSNDSDFKSYGPSESVSSSDFTGLSTPSAEAEAEHEKSADLKLPFATVMEAFNETKRITDDRIAEFKQTDYADIVLPVQTKMCVALVIEAFDELGVELRTAKPGDEVPRISHPREHERLVDYLYQMLEKEARIIVINGDTITRTAVPVPSSSSSEVLEELCAHFPDQNTANKLTYYTGSKLAQVLRGETDGIKLIFGTPEGRELVSGLYGDWPLNRLLYKQMEEFLARLVSKLDMTQGPLKILEMGAGTGGTTKWLVPLLASLNVPVEYTFTDLAPSFVAAARKRFKTYPFMKFRAHDIEKSPAEDLVETQHIVVASNAVHATHSLRESGENMRKALRSDGFLMMLEMTGTLYWVDMIFGLFEGWWFFEDGRMHAVTNEQRWETELQAVGYGHVDWTDGNRPENKYEKLIIAMASPGDRCERLPIPPVFPEQPIIMLKDKSKSADIAARQVVVNKYVSEMTDGFSDALETAAASSSPASLPSINLQAKRVLVTGATGSLGSHLIFALSLREDVASIVCLNRRSKQDPVERQQQALQKKGISLPKVAIKKLTVYETDLSRPNLGLSVEVYEELANSVTHIVHNAWMMNAKWPLVSFEPQLRIMRNLITLSRDMSSRRPLESIVTFQFVSSIATVGHQPLWTGEAHVKEERVAIGAVLPTGYGDAKYICELMLDATLHRHPDRFRAMVVRPGQIAGSSVSGYWNPAEHFSFLIKSSQTLRALPDFDGLLSWTPVDVVAGTLVDLLTLPEDKTPSPVYHIDNPVRQPWKDTISILSAALDIPSQNVIPFTEWVQRVRDYSRDTGGQESANPAIRLIDFLDDNFLRMSCGGLLLDTFKARQDSRMLAKMGPISESLTRLFVKCWIDTGFLSK